MHDELVRLDLRLRRRLLIGTALGAMVYLVVVVAVYPSFQHDTSINSLIESNPMAAAALGINGSITSTSGWLSANMYANVGPLLGLLLSIGYGAAAIAGQASDGLLGLVATTPTTRGQLVAQKVIALLLIAAVVPIASLLVCLLAPRFHLTPDWGALVGVTIALTVLAFDLGALALFVGALTGNRGSAVGVASGVAAVSYLISSLAPVVHAVERLRWLSPFSWAVGQDQLATGVTPAQWAALVGVGAVLIVATARAFVRLDVP